MLLIQWRDAALVAEYQRMLGLYEHYQLGILPNPGAWMDQHARYTDWMLAIGRQRAATQKAFNTRDETARKEQERALAESRREDNAQRRRGGVVEQDDE